MKAKIIRAVLIVVALVEFYEEFVHHKELIFFTKPLMLPLIAAYFFFSIQKQWNKIHTLMMFAFLFSWFGDVSLMLTPETITDTELMGIPKSELFFSRPGLVPFLLPRFYSSMLFANWLARLIPPLVSFYICPLFFIG